MELTAKNIGEIYCLEPDSRMVQLVGVTPRLLTYLTENGDRFSSYDRRIPGAVIQDNALRLQFEKTSTVGVVLNAAGCKALSILESGHEDLEEREQASCVIKFINEQRRHMDMKKDPERQSGRSSLDAIIRRANAQREQGGQQGKFKSAPQREDR